MPIHVITPVATGVCLHDRAEDESSDVIRVKLLELLPNLSGAVTDTKDVLSVKVTTPTGVVTREVRVGDWVPATWLNLNDRLLTAPYVVEGMRVLVYRVGDSQDYYWETMDIDANLKTLERVVIAISNTNPSDRSNKVLSKDNCYFIIADTFDKKIAIHTNKNDGEPFAYDFVLDTLNGFFKGNDDVGNHMLMDSKNTVIEFINKELTQYRMDKKDILEVCKGNHTRKVGGNLIEEVTGQVTRKVGKDYSEDIGGNTTRKTGGNETVNVDGAISIKSASYAYQGSTYAVTAAFTMSGSTKLSGGSMTFNGTISHQGDLTSTGKVEAQTVKGGSVIYGSLSQG